MVCNQFNLHHRFCGGQVLDDREVMKVYIIHVSEKEFVQHFIGKTIYKTTECPARATIFNSKPDLEWWAWFHGFNPDACIGEYRLEFEKVIEIKP